VATLKDLLILSRYPIIAVETYGVFVWTPTDGFRRRGAETPIYDTQKPLVALATSPPSRPTASTSS
jgi:hypothetical protein